MGGGRSVLYDRGEVAETGDVAAAAVALAPVGPLELGAAQIEIATLRSINRQLVAQVTALKRREAQAQRLADRDGLTGLYNRRKMLSLLDCCIADAMQQSHRVALLFVDLDGFKAVNDRYGHAAGDKLLVTLASRINGRSRTGDLVCRYGGDEFVIILPRVADPDAAREVADCIGRRVSLAYRFEGDELRVTAAIGVALFPDEARSASALLRLADESMYRAKAGPREPREAAELQPTPTRRHDDRSKRHY